MLEINTYLKQNLNQKQAANYIGMAEQEFYLMEAMKYILSRKKFEMYKKKLIEIVKIN